VSGSSLIIQVKDQLSAIFDDIYDAWVFFDQNCDFSIQLTEMERGFKFLGIGADPKKLIENLDKNVRDGKLDFKEFVKGLAWHSVPGNQDTVNDLLDDARRRRQTIQSSVVRRATSSTPTHEASAARQHPSRSGFQHASLRSRGQRPGLGA